MLDTATQDHELNFVSGLVGLESGRQILQVGYFEPTYPRDHIVRPDPAPFCRTTSGDTGQADSRPTAA